MPVAGCSGLYNRYTFASVKRKQVVAETKTLLIEIRPFERIINCHCILAAAF
jgi:hypothetical protein